MKTKIILSMFFILIVMCNISSAKFANSDIPELKNIFQISPAQYDVTVSYAPDGSGGLLFSSSNHEVITISIPPGKIKKFSPIEPVIHLDDNGQSSIVYSIPRNNNGWLEFDWKFTTNCLYCYTGTFTQSFVNKTNGSQSNLSQTFNSANISTITVQNISTPSTKNITSLAYNTSGLVLALTMNETTGTLVEDFSGNGNNCTYNGHTVLNSTTGKHDSGIQFDGVNDYLECIDSESLNITNGTISLWFYRNAKNATGYERLLQKADGAGIKRGYSLIFGFGITDSKVIGEYQPNYITGTVASRTVLTTSLNTWYNIAMVFDSTSVLLYLNGVSTNQAATGDTGATAIGSGIVVGRKVGEASRLFNGIIDEVRIYNRALPTDEIQQNHYNSKYYFQAKTNSNTSWSSMCENCTNFTIPFSTNDSSIDNVGSAVSTTNLSGYWTFNASSGTTAEDVSGNGNTGTLTNMNTTHLNNLTSGWNSSGKYRNALMLDGFDDYVNAGNGASLNITGDITISAWVKPIFSQNGYIVTKASSSAIQYSFVIEGLTNTLRFRTTGDTSSALSNTALSLNQYSHVAAVLSSGTVTYYLNGISDGTDTGHSITSQALSVLIGARRVTGDTGTAVFFNGSIDDVRIYNSALSADEIEALYANGIISHVDVMMPRNQTIDGRMVYDYWNNTNVSFDVQIGYTENTTTISETSVNGYHYTNTSIKFANNGTGNISFQFSDPMFLANSWGAVSLSTNPYNPNATITRNTTHYTIYVGAVNNSTIYYNNITDTYFNTANITFSSEHQTEPQIYQSSQANNISVNINASGYYITGAQVGISHDGIETNYTLSGGNDTWYYLFKSGHPGVYTVTRFYANASSTEQNSTTSTLWFTVVPSTSIGSPPSSSGSPPGGGYVITPTPTATPIPTPAPTYNPPLVIYPSYPIPNTPQITTPSIDNVIAEIPGIIDTTLSQTDKQIGSFIKSIQKKDPTTSNWLSQNIQNGINDFSPYLDKLSPADIQLFLIVLLVGFVIMWDSKNYNKKRRR